MNIKIRYLCFEKLILIQFIWYDVWSLILNFRCDGVGHIARDCSQSASEPSCYNCRKTGHLARDCPDERAERGYGGNSGGISSSTCYNCNKIGHFSRDCMESR
jgi:cellular nucleic acid-binding protein